MKRYFAAVAASVILSSSAHAALYTFEYTATVSSIAEYPDAFGFGSAAGVQSTSITTGKVSVGDTITGIIGYDSQLAIASQYDYNGAHYIGYGYIPSLNLTADFAAANIHFESNAYKFGGQAVYPAGSTDKDAFGLGTYRYLYLPGGGMSQETLIVDLADSTHTKLDGSVPGSIATTFDSNQMTYIYADNFADRRAEIGANITALRLVSAVPEPGTYAMLLGGLMLLAWRRRSQA